ncbi:flagellar basal body rod protein FlgC [Liquorilactobacillus vini]|uniref:Flagellar basal-body rod protein FlgC n=1 Tax=Liquorilactobacillus vini DSM 20605 TaxID=1133569 RepID=A0A0A7RGV3_9LACO|nr:flagellar basal body rod protein FlgC [Liquorilactobacillus vini]AJA34507.1 flagellar basal-body rod protein FlgC [Liquorilactobacillus vini DSM 20605]
MSIFDGLEINTSGLALERLKMDTISTNIANVNTDQTAEGGPYKSKSVLFSENVKNVSTSNPAADENGQMSYGVKVDGIQEDDSVKRVYDPTDPNADSSGYVETSNVNLADQMVDMIQTMRSYEANESVAEDNKDILKDALNISKG